MNKFVLVAVLGSVIAFATYKASTHWATKEITNVYTNTFDNTTRVPGSLNNQIKVKLDPVKINFQRSVTLFGEVNGDSIGEAIIKLETLNKESADPIYLMIASPGGSVFDGEALIAAMESSKAPVSTICVSLCASMGAVIHQHGVQGEVKKMQAMLTMVEAKLERTNRYIAERAKMSYQAWLDLHAHDLWIESLDAKKIGLVDKVIPYQTPVGASSPSVTEVLKKSNATGTLIELNN